MFNLIYIILNIVIALVVYIIARIIYLKKKNRNTSKVKWLRELLIAGLVAYTAAMTVLLFFHFNAGLTLFTDKGFLNPIERLQENIGINFIPFKSISEFISLTDSPILMIRNVLGNIILFVPIGFLMGLLWEKWSKPKNVLLFSLLVPIGIEFIQLFIGRAVDVDDVILNFAGLMTGFLLAKAFNNLFLRFSLKYISCDKV